MKIAVIGAGTAGLAVSAFLKKSGNDVTIYEQFESPRPVGTGLMLQPTGLAVLAKLELDKRAIASSSPIYRLQGHVAKTGQTIFNISYRTLAPHIFGLGTHRATLFSLLYDEVLRLEISVVKSAAIKNIEYDEKNFPIISDSSNRYGPFDLVINAQGARAALRQRLMKVNKDKPYSYAAIWGTCKDFDGAFKNALFQRYRRAHHMIGIMPVGKLGDDTCESLAFFWSLRAKDYPAWRKQDFKQWQDHVAFLWPEVSSLVRQFKTSDDLSFATYGDVSLNTCHVHRVVFIGDAAHATSPQLGQGANMGLLDAFVLDECLREKKDLEAALKSYAEKRRKHLRFYQTASHWLTPFFQSDSYILPFIRDLTFGLMCKFPFLRLEMVRTLAGVKTGLFTSMNPGEIHPDYDVRHAKS